MTKKEKKEWFKAKPPYFFYDEIPEAGIRHWLYVVETTIVVFICVLAATHLTAEVIAEKQAYPDLAKIALMIGCFAVLPLLFANRCKQVFFQISIARLSFPIAIGVLFAHICALIWLGFKSHQGIYIGAHATTGFPLLIHLKAAKLQLLFTGLYFFLAYLASAFFLIFPKTKKLDATVAVYVLFAANIVLLGAFTLDFGHLNSETHISTNALKKGLDKQTREASSRSAIIAVLPKSEQIKEVAKNVATGNSFLELHGFSANVISNNEQAAYVFDELNSGLLTLDSPYQPFKNTLYEVNLNKVTDFCWLEFGKLTTTNLHNDAVVARHKLNECIDDALMLSKTNFFKKFNDGYLIKKNIEHSVLDDEPFPIFHSKPQVEPRRLFFVANNQQNSLAQLIDQEGIKQIISGVNKNAFAQPYLANAVYTGFFSHHFNIIAEGFREIEAGNPMVSNQYGMGPIGIIKAISVILGLNVYDSILVAPTLSFAVVFVCLAFFIRNVNQEHTATIYASLFLGMFCTWWFSHFFAPFLYPIRYLPTILLSALLTSRFLNSTKQKRFFSDVSLTAFCLPFIAIYNFEYAIPTCLAVVAAAIISRHFGLSLLALMSFLVATFIKFYPVADQTYAAVDFQSYFDKSTFGDLDAISSVYLGMLVLIVLFYLLRIKSQDRFASDAVIFLALTCSYKAIGVGSANHLSAGFLMLGCAVCVLHKTISPSNNYNRLLKRCFLGSYIFGLLICFVIIVSNGRFSLHFELPTERYVSTEFSTLQPVSEGLAEKASDFGTLLKEESLIISPTDVVLSIWHGRSLTTPFNELGSTITKPRLYQQIATQYMNSDHIIVDRFISDKNYFDEIISLLSEPLYSNHLGGRRHWEIIDAMKNLHKQIINTNQFKLCGTSKHFVAYCKV